MKDKNQIRLTQYSHGAGCGCKISPALLSEIIKTDMPGINDKKLLVGNDSRDDAAVYDIGNDEAIISTTDFFMPIVDDPFTFGKIAAVNAISDVYAMGGTPIVAIAILGWPIDKLDASIAQKVLEGGRSACQAAGITLAGGHSIDSPEPIFGLAVTGKVNINNLKKNNTATVGDKLYLTKPLGVGILSTAQKRGELRNEDANLAPNSMTVLNTIGEKLGLIEGVSAMTDVTGFGLLGHLVEMSDGSNLTSVVNFNKVPLLENIEYYISKECIPGGTSRNWNSYGNRVQLKDETMKSILCDPQTSGGLLIAVRPEACKEVENLLNSNNIAVSAFGEITNKQEKCVIVQ